MQKLTQRMQNINLKMIPKGLKINAIFGMLFTSKFGEKSPKK